MSVSAPLPSRSWLVRRRTAIGLWLAIALVGTLVFVHHSWPEEAMLDFVLDTLGYVLLVLGVLGRLWCTLYIGGRKHEELQTTGPYSIVRHPLYVSNLLLAVGISSLSENPLVLLVVLCYFLWQYSCTIRYEEAALRVTFGHVYDEYMQRVPRFLPRFRQADFTPPSSVNMWALRAELPRILLFLAAIPLLELLARLHEQGILPYIPFP